MRYLSNIFSDFWCNFLPQEGVFHKCSKSKYQCIHQNKFFGTHFVCEKHPLHVFFFFPLFACIDLLKLFHLPIFGELRKLHAKNFMFSVKIGREIIFQSWQLFDLFFTQCYNFPIVHWWLFARWTTTWSTTDSGGEKRSSPLRSGLQFKGYQPSITSTEKNLLGTRRA